MIIDLTDENIKNINIFKINYYLESKLINNETQKKWLINVNAENLFFFL